MFSIEAQATHRVIVIVMTSRSRLCERYRWLSGVLGGRRSETVPAVAAKGERVTG